MTGWDHRSLSSRELSLKPKSWVRKLETEKNLKPLPVLALTANVSSDDVALCLASGMDGHLAKPFERADLEEALAKLTTRKGRLNRHAICHANMLMVQHDATCC